MHADFPPNINDDARALYEERDAYDGHKEVGHVGGGENVHEAQIATDVDDVGNGSLVAFAQLE